jgi:hypothetical protein
MKTKILFIFFLFPLFISAQRDSTRHDTLILDKFFNFVGKGFRNTFHHVPKDTINRKPRQKLKLDFSFEAGTQYQSLLRNHHFPLDTSFQPEVNLQSIGPYGRVGITYKPSFGYHTALACVYTFKRNFKIESGLQLYYGQEKYIEDNDTIERNIVNKYNAKYRSALDTFKSSQNSYVDIIVPVYFGYSFKRFSSFIGLKLPIFTFAKTRVTTLHNLNLIELKANQFFYDDGILSLKFEYLILNNKHKVSAYLAIDDRGRKYYDFQIGFKFYFIKPNMKI